MTTIVSRIVSGRLGHVTFLNSANVSSIKFGVICAFAAMQQL